MRTFPASFDLVRLEVWEVAKFLVKAIVMKFNFLFCKLGEATSTFK